MADTIGLIGDTLFSTGSAPQAFGLEGRWVLKASAQTGKSRAERVTDHATLSLQEDGSQQTREQGADGPFEKLSVSGNALIFEYEWPPNSGSFHAHVVAWRELTGVQGT